MFFHIIFLTSCSPVNKTTQSQKTSDENQNVQKNILIENKTVDNNVLLENKIVNKKSELSNNITVLLSKNKNDLCWKYLFGRYWQNTYSNQTL